MILTREDLGNLGLGDWALGWADTVRFGELDPLGHVNNAAYLVWFEALRVRHLTAIGFTQYRPEDPRFVVAALDATYRAELKLHEDYVLATRCTRVGRTSFVMAYRCMAGGRADAASGSATVVMLRDGRPAPLSDEQRAALGADAS